MKSDSFRRAYLDVISQMVEPGEMAQGITGKYFKDPRTGVNLQHRIHI